MKENQELSFAQQEVANEKAQVAQKTANRAGSSKSNSVFSSNIANLLYSTLKGAAVGFFVVYFLTQMVYSSIYIPNNIETIIRVVLTIACGIAWALLFCNINIVVDESGLHFHRNGKNYLNINLFDIESVKSKTTIYGFIPVVTRVVIYKSNNKFKTTTCHCFSKKDFDEMIDLINIYRREIAAAAQEQEELQQTEQVSV